MQQRQQQMPQAKHQQQVTQTQQQQCNRLLRPWLRVQQRQQQQQQQCSKILQLQQQQLSWRLVIWSWCCLYWLLRVFQ
jgi:hypothetical protein